MPNDTLDFVVPKALAADADRDFRPLALSISEIRAAIPAHLFVRNTWRSTTYLIRDLALAATFWWLATFIDGPLVADQVLTLTGGSSHAVAAVRVAAWLAYWWFQGLAFTGIWVIGHECGHGGFSGISAINDVIGFVTHTLLWTPYFSWRISHHRHHANHASMERDEVYVPWTRSELGIPSETEESSDEGTSIDWEEMFSDTPIYTLFMLIAQQTLAFPAYLIFNVSGQRKYPKWTNHFDPNAILFQPMQRNAVLMSNVGILAMIAASYFAIQTFGWWKFVALYFIPWLCVSHWFIMISYLHHTAPLVPHYRAGQWTFARGAAATVDRPFLGWQGRFFLHDVAHYHVIHHFFPKMPWCM